MTQRYLGIPNAVVLCIKEHGIDLKGEFWHHFSKESVPFENTTGMLLKMEELFDAMQFPWPGYNERHFLKGDDGIMKKEELIRLLEDEEMLDMHGDLGTFIIRVQHRQNSSWQGRITWVEEDKTVYFRSVWEMVKLIEEALGDQKEEDTEDATWQQ